MIALGACDRGASAEEAFNRRVHAYLMAHPEVIEEAVQRLQVKASQDEAVALRRAQADLPRLRAAVERDPRDFVANPTGRITLTEFYDYRCAHCINAAPKVLALIRANPDLRVVFKEMPIFGATSEHAARAAFAVKAAGGDYLRFYEILMATRGLDDTIVDRVAQRLGAQPASLAPSPAADRQLAETAALFNKLALGGTPAFIVGDQIISGEDMDAVNAAVAKARAALARRA